MKKQINVSKKFLNLFLPVIKIKFQKECLKIEKFVDTWKRIVRSDSEI